MRKRINKYIHLVLLVATMVGIAACSTKKNTATSRMWHSFTARYNTYYNGHEAYKQGMLAKEGSNKDNYSTFIPVFMVGNEQSRTVGSSNFETAITKCKKAIQLHSISKRPKMDATQQRSEKTKAYLAQKEFNPFLRHAWMLMGEAYFQKGNFLEAASVFSYVTRHYATQPLIVNEARAYLMRCYTELEWYYDAEDIYNRLQRDTVNKKIRRIADLSQANLLLRQEKYEQAIPFLEKAAKKAPSNLRKARLHFLLGQIYQHLGQEEKAYKAFDDCLDKNPPYNLAFNARIHQTEVVGKGKLAKKMLRRLARMAHDDKNKEYLDQIYYAIGNIHMAAGDTLTALGEYEKGRTGATRNGPEKGVLVLRMAELYWERGDYENARACYSDAVSLIDKEHKLYAEIKRRSTVLDELAPITSAIHLQDSLLALSTMSEADRNAAIDRVIEELKRKEKEAEELAADSAAEARRLENGGTPSQQNKQNNNAAQQGGDQSWYFYNATAVTQGKQTFQKLWGKRKLEDDWRRNNRSVITFDNEESTDSLKTDSFMTDSLLTDSAALAADLPENDPHNREYYLAQIPFTEGQKIAAHAIIESSLYDAALIEKDKLEDFPLAEKTFERLLHDYPEFKKLADAYYQLFLMYSRWGKQSKADYYRNMMATHFPDDENTIMITAPDYEYRARYAKELEDSLYRATYEAYRLRQNEQVWEGARQSAELYPKGLNRPKFIFVDILSRLATTSTDTLITELRNLVETYPKSDVSTLAGMMVKGLESGRSVGTGALDIGSLWSMREETTNKSAEELAEQQQFETEQNTRFCFLIAYPTDSINDNQLLYDLAHFNFTSYMARIFDLRLQRGKAITQFIVGGFNSFAEVHQYVQRMSLNTELSNKLSKARTFLISEQNVALIGTAFSYDDYAKFYEHHFAPAELDASLKSFDEGLPLQRYEDELSPEELQQHEEEKEKTNNSETEVEDDGGEWY